MQSDMLRPVPVAVDEVAEAEDLSPLVPPDPEQAVSAIAGTSISASSAGRRRDVGRFGVLMRFPLRSCRGPPLCLAL